MPSAFHTFKLVPAMASATPRQPTPILPPSTPSNNNVSRPGSQHGPTPNNQPNETPTSTPTSEARMNPPPLPRPVVTPAREMRESSVASSAGGSSSRKPRQNLEERDHILMLTHCYDQRANFKEGTKAQFWTNVNTAFQRDTGKVLAQMSASVARLVEARRRQISDWEAGVIPQKPGGELNERLDQWMEFLKVEDGDNEAERMKQVDARRKVEEARKEARRQAIAAEALASAQNPPDTNTYLGSQAGPPPPPPPMAPMGHPPQHSQPPPQHHQQPSQPQPHYQQPPPHPHPHQYSPAEHHQEMVVANGEQDMNGNRPHKRKRGNERTLTRELQAQLEQQQWEAQQYALSHPPEPPRRVVVEGALTKEDWKDIMGNDARLRTLENKVDKIELIVSQNNKLLLQLLQNQSKERSRSVEEERVPVHLDADFERDYLSGQYSKTPLPIT